MYPSSPIGELLEEKEAPYCLIVIARAPRDLRIYK
jgi:hypothetical protein